MNKFVVKKILAGVGLLLGIIAIALFAAPFMTNTINDATMSGFDIMKESNSLVNTGGVITTLFFTITLTIFFLIIAIVALAQKKPFAKKGAGITFSIIGGIVAFITLILDCITPEIVYVELPSIPSYISVGGGAVASGLLLFMGVGVSAASLFLGEKRVVVTANTIATTAAAAAAAATAANAASAAPKVDGDQLKALKDLLDSGVITQEEFDAKKKELLGL